eukprot:UN06841
MHHKSSYFQMFELKNSNFEIFQKMTLLGNLLVRDLISTFTSQYFHDCQV